MRFESPGKLYLCGEYAVLRPGSFAIASPTKRKLWVEAQESEEGSLSSSLFPAPLPFAWQGGAFISPIAPEKCFALFAVRVLEGFCRREAGKDLKLEIKIGSGLEEGGKKLGFGSSAALCCALARAITCLYGVHLSEAEMLKLAILAHFSWQGSGSGGDVAASLLGPVFYASFDSEWLSRHLSFEAVFKNWPGLFAEKLSLPPLSSLALWTGKPASTASLIRGVKPGRKFVERSDDLCLIAKDGALKGEADLVKRAIRLSRYNLESFAKREGIPLENREVRRAIEIAEALGAAAKTSGAGGGDCALALGSKGECRRLSCAWKAAGFAVFDDVLDLKREK
ncbi:MAG: phosphomevalonate kinase [Aeriscardovia sp.]|nr:phosphomevalonate kinase [Aeriscardovia sp.]